MSKNKSTIDLTSGCISLGLVKFSLPLMAGNVLQQCYNLTDTLVVGRFIGKNALAAVGSAYTLMIFLTSIILGLNMGCGAFLSIKYGAKEDREFAIGNWLSFCGTGLFSILLTLLVYLLLGFTANLLAIPASIHALFNQYLLIIYAGIPATFLQLLCLQSAGHWQFSHSPDLPLPVFSLEYYSLHLAGSRTRAGRGRVSLSHRHFPVLCRPWLNHLCLGTFSPAPF